MSSGARQTLQYAIETTNGTTPSPFARTALPFTSTSLDQTASREQSNTITTGRIAQQGNISSVEIAGDIEAEFRYRVFDDFISAVAFNNWVLGADDDDPDTLTFGGTVRKSFSILRGYEDVNVYETFAGVHVNTWALSIPETGIINNTFGLMGKKRTPSTTAPTGSVTPATLNPTLSSVSVGNILIDGESQVGIACISSIDFNWDNTMQVQRCLGAGLSIGNIIETAANGSGSFTMAWSTKAGQDYYERQFKNQTIGLEITIYEDPDDLTSNQYTLSIPEVEITMALPSGGKDEILQATVEFNVVNQSPVLSRLAKPTP